MRKKLLSVLLASTMSVSLLAGCGGSNEAVESSETPASSEVVESSEAPTEAPASSEAVVEDTNADTPLVVGYAPFSSKFSPFFAETGYDQDAQSMTQVALLGNDRQGAMIYNGIEGETISYNGTDYTYYGIADCTVTENADGTVYYDFKLREDVKFSDGEALTADDVIFSYYVLADPTYDGSSSFYAQPVEGMEAYRSGMDTLFNLLVTAGPENTDYTYWDEATQTAFWADLNQAGAAFAQEIVDYCIAAGYGDSVATAAAAWAFDGLPAEATAEDFFAMMCEAYAWDLATLSSTESAGSSLFDLMEGYSNYTIGIQTGDSAPSITGIQKIDDYNVRIVMTEVDATSIYQLAIQVAPMHYYGDASLFDYDNNSFGFTKGDLSTVRSKTTQPMGAGPYKFVKFENGVINFEANENYYLGAPKTKYINFLETQEADKLNGVVTGTVDITDPSYNKDAVAAIQKANGGETNGDVITVSTVDNLGYGYIGMCAEVMKVGDDKASDASKNLRKAFGTIFSVYRDVAIDSYYGELATVINYPISNTSWAAPQSTDDGYEIAFSKDVNGNPIYTSTMTAEEKYEAAKQAALGYFEAAGYTVTDGKLTAAPEGAELEYELLIPGDGAGDHPSFMICTLASEALAEIGMNLIVTDLTNSSDLWTALSAQTCAIWCAAWGATIDPDMFQIYHPDGGSNYQYAINDDELSQLIMDARATTDQTFRKAMYKACLDIIIDWAVEIPVYQRQNAIIFSTERVNMSTVTPDITTFYGWMAEVQNIELN
ncbi:MAG: ABC transporter substrate-binding protein [Lachnospiraceae bacterium]|nr:ABC transporter substrate-binding protein [Lachnospiraceae bacterium]